MAIVLIVDDNELVRGLSVLVLRQQGHDVIDVESADDALTTLARQDEGGEGVDAVVTDLTMPGSLDGSDLVALLRSERPGVGIVVTTGHAVEPGTFDDRVVVLSKPFGVDDLSRAVTEVLTSR